MLLCSDRLSAGQLIASVLAAWRPAELFVFTALLLPRQMLTGHFSIGNDVPSSRFRWPDVLFGCF